MRRIAVLAMTVLVAGCAPDAGVSTTSPVTTSTTLVSPTSSTSTLPEGLVIPPQCEGRTITTTPPVEPTSTTITPEELTMASQLLVLESFDQLFRDTYFDPDLGGIDWDAAIAGLRAEINSGVSTAVLYERLDALVESLGDEHSRFETPAQVAESDEIFAGDNDYEGIGIVATAVPEDQLITIITVFPGSPADLAGIESHDSILAVDGIALGDEPGRQSARLRGPECSLVTMTVRTPGEPDRSVAAVRARVTGNIPIEAMIVPDTAGRRVGFMMIPTFADNTIDDQVRDTLEEWGPLDGLILDLRVNGGGSSVVAEPIMSLFVSGLIGEYASREDTRQLSIEADPIHNSATVPLAVFIGEHTESYGEIISGILGSRDRTVLIGSTTTGNVETLHGFSLPGGSKLWIAAEVFRLLADPDADWERDGISPDIEILADWEDFTFDTDPALDAALTALAAA
ncbi:MAG: S41 family peptidase [Acidimicrobiia bacterium]